MDKLIPLAVYKNGNHTVTIFNDGTKIKATFDKNADHFTYDFAENADIKITDYCNIGCPYCHEDSSKKGKHADLKSMENLFKTLHAGTELAIGGGNALEHPDIEWFLKLLKKQGVLANITVNQKSLTIDAIKKIKKWQKNDLIHGIGISLTDSEHFNSDLVDSLGENVVIHTIAGILEEKDYNVLKNRKVLILGYKDLRRGTSFIKNNFETISHNQKSLCNNLSKLSNLTKCMSFDCLAIEQLNPKNKLHMSDEEYNTYYQGSDTDVLDKDGNITCATFYINAVDKTCARMSTAALDKRFKFSDTESIDDLFKKSIQDW